MVIAAVRGYAVGAGFEISIDSDMIVAAEDAVFGFPESNAGMTITGGATKLLPMIVGLNKARELMLTGEFIDAPTALEYGLVNRVVAPDILDKTVMALAQNIARKPAETLRLGKSLFYRQLEHSLEEAYRDAGEIMACNMMFEDAVEGIDAFIEKREPDWAKP